MSGNIRLPAPALAGGLVALVALAGCASHQQEPAPGHPEHQEARAHDGHSGMDHGSSHTAPQTVPPGQPATILRPDALDAPAATSVTDARRSAEMAAEMTGGHGGHGSHGGGTYTHVDAGREPAGPHHHDHGPATAAPSGQEGDHSGHQPPGGAAKDAAAVYACPMHPDVTSATPGKCPKCGMELVKRRKE